MQLTPELAAELLAADLNNIVLKIRSGGTLTADQAKRIAQAIFDDIELSRCLSLDRVTDVIERMTNTPSPAVRYISEVMSIIERMDGPPIDYMPNTIIWRSPTRQPDKTIIQPDD